MDTYDDAVVGYDDVGIRFAPRCTVKGSLYGSMPPIADMSKEEDMLLGLAVGSGCM